MSITLDPDNDAYGKSLRDAYTGAGSSKSSIPTRAGNASSASAITGALGNGFTRGFPALSTILAVAGIAMIVGAVVLVTIQGSSSNRAGFIKSGSNCTEIVCPAGPLGAQGVPGVAGPPGAAGERGERGEVGPAGAMGMPGPAGEMGACLANPLCMIGPPGATGAQGVPGPTGLAGLPGPTGAAGVIGPSGFVGATGPSGPSGPTGATGVQGIPGVCNCLNLGMVHWDNLFVNDTLTLNGTMTCPGGALDPSCFGLSTCPDFSGCRLKARALDVWSNNLTDLASISVGLTPGDVGGGSAIFGFFGGPPLNTFSVNVNGTFLMSSVLTPIQMFASNADIVLDVVGTPTQKILMTSTGYINMTSVRGIGLTSNFGIVNTCNSVLTNWNCVDQLITSQTPLNFTVSAKDFIVTKTSALKWFETQSNNTLQCAGSPGPFAVIAGSSMMFSTDVVFASGTKLMTNAASGLLGVSGLELCGQLIKTTAATLQLQDATVSKELDVRAQIYNGELALPITFTDADGADFAGTPLFDSTPLMPLLCNDTEGLRVSAGPVSVDEIRASTTPANLVSINVLNGFYLGGPVTMSIPTANTLINGPALALSIQPSVDGASLDINRNTGGFMGGIVGISRSGAMTTVYGNLNVVGSLNAGSCMGCVSDARVKHNITAVSPHDDLALVLAIPRRVAFQYSAGYQKEDPFVKDYVHHGFIAQELERVLPRAVHSGNRTVDGVEYTDFRSLHLERIVPHVVGAVKALHEELRELKKEVAELRALVKGLLSKGA
jgi:hypothetical protein